MWSTMWADAQHDGRPAEYRWLPLRKFPIPFLIPRRKVWLTPTAGVLRSDYANMRTQDLDAKWILHLANFHQGATAPKMYI